MVNGSNYALSVGILYDRFETEEHTIIRYSRFLVGVTAVVGVMFVLLVLVRSLWFSVLVYFLLLMFISREMRPVREELIAAQAEGALTKSGRRLSLRNPLTYYIKKKPRKGQRKPKRQR